MSSVDDMRKLFQDLITPDLKALEARFIGMEQKFDSQEKRIDLKFSALDSKVDALEKRVDLKSNTLELQLDFKIDALDKKFESKIDALDKRFDSKIDALDHKLDYKFDLLMGEIRNLALVVSSNHAVILNALDINRRMEKIETELAAKAN